MILYIGNMLSKHSGSVSVIELLGPKLERYYDIKMYSSKKSQAARLVEMLWKTFQHRSNITLVIIDSYSTTAFWYTILVSLVCRMLRVPYIPIVHGGNFPQRLQTSKRLSQFVFSNAALTISPSLYLKQAFEKHHYPITYIPNAIEVNRIPFRLRKMSSPKLLWVRAFHEIYNPTLAVHVIHLLKKVYPEILLCMIGSQKDHSYQKSIDLAEMLNVADNIKFYGSMDRTEWMDLANEYDIFLNTTNFDNMPLSLIEAMALGLPIVSTNVGGVPFLIENNENGILTSPNNADEMASKIIEILNHPELAEKFSKNNRRKAMEFDWDNVKRSWFKVISDFEQAKAGAI